MHTPPSPSLSSALLPPKAKGQAGSAVIRGSLLLAIVLIHGLLLWCLATAQPQAAPSVAPPIQVSLIAPPQPAPSPAPLALPPAAKPQRISRPAPTPIQRPQPPTPRPAPLSAPPAEAPMAPGPVAAIQPTAPAPTTPAPVVQEPPTTPRFDAAYLNNKTPYPPLARRLKETGTVKLRVLVSAEGLAERIELISSSGSPRLDEGAQEAVGRWRFIPARQGDRPVASSVIVPIIYKLEDS